MKAFLVWHDQPFRWTHDLEELLQQCAGIEDKFTDHLTAAEQLSQYAVETRYPGLYEPTEDEMSEAQRLARSVVEFVIDVLPDAVRVELQ